MTPTGTATAPRAAPVERAEQAERPAPAERDAPRAPHARLETTYTPRHALDLHRTVVHQRHGSNDPSLVVDGPVIWRASRTPAGIATVALRATAGGAVRAAAWGPGADWALDQVPALCGAHDDPDGFDADRHPLIASSHHRHPGLRLGRTDLVFDALASAIFEQKVTGMQAFGAWRRIVTWFGERAPGPTPRPMFAPPSIDQWRRIPSWSWHRAGLEPAQSRTVVQVAARGTSLVRTLDAAAGGEARESVLTALRGVGPWTSAETRIRAYGDPDAVSVGDYHLAHQVGHALTGTRTDDDGMLALLAPWAGHRQRVIRLIGASGVQEPRRGPRLHPEDHRAR
ncbi:DNA-3-methyladenine glycosylase 2 family protein [Microbacterium sp. cx-55]|uniref:DNA-3-methyladenine glycosylase family protein n=1 Tax=Microbacterium sp. cx-55 TaxID=2875948 RepID=UPI001CBF8560|nr:DNA-3-methyladenine glycosylase 2 family protein [Microbacterium sp. cx-55]UGB35701.1 DNA-3-methyladenine glycosylase 2 family protein [Microbacterium sp. cx-55]